LTAPLSPQRRQSDAIMRTGAADVRARPSSRLLNRPGPTPRSPRPWVTALTRF